MNLTADAPVFDSRALAKFSALAIAVCMIFDCGYAFIFPMITAVSVEIVALLVGIYFLGWWSQSFRYTMKTAGLVLSFVLPNVAMGFLVVILMSLQIARVWR